MGFPCDEFLRNHSKGLSGRFYTLWARSGQSPRQIDKSIFGFGTRQLGEIIQLVELFALVS